jgi:predicted dehydrogenase
MNSDAPTYKVAIIGAGKIGCGYDAPHSERVLTHAHAITKNPRLILGGIVDTDAARGKQEAQKWNTIFFDNLEEMQRNVMPEVVVIATPDDTHTSMLERTLVGNAKLVILEKPPATNLDEETRMRSLRTPVPIIVNYRRQFDQRMQSLRKEISSGTYGDVIVASGLYTGGLFHNGSHMLDLARMLFGEMKNATALHRLTDTLTNDASISGVATFEQCPEFFLKHGDGRSYWAFELDILMQKKRVRLIDEGFLISTEDVIKDPIFEGFKKLAAPVLEKTNLDNAMPNLYAHAVAVLDGTEMPQSSLENALKTHAACSQFARIPETA